MQLILPSEFYNILNNDEYGYSLEKEKNKEVLKVFSGEDLIAKRIKQRHKAKGAVRYFGCKNYKDYIIFQEQ